MGILSGVGGAVAGFSPCVLLVRLDWLDGPGGMFVFRLVFVPAMASGLYGYRSSLTGMQTAARCKIQTNPPPKGPLEATTEQQPIRPAAAAGGSCGKDWFQAAQKARRVAAADQFAAPDHY